MYSSLKSTSGPIGRFARSTAAAFIFIGVLGIVTAVRSETPMGVFTYTIHTDRFGKVGNFTNVIRSEGASIIVESRTEIEVKFLFVTAFHFFATSRAVWKHGRIVRYESFTDDDGRISKVSARAKDYQLVIDGTAGKVIVPAGVFPHNPWNIGILGARAIMSPKSGRLFPAKISGGHTDDVDRPGESSETVIYQIDTDRRTWVWYDRNDVPVRFVMERKRGRELLTFILAQSD